MNSRQYAKRQALVFQFTKVLEKWPDHNGVGFLQEMSTLVREFEALVAEVEEASSDRLERARNYRYLGNAYFDLGAGHNTKWLERACVAYTLAEALLEGIENPIEEAKLAYSHGRALFGKSRLSDLRLVEEARQKYLLALALARKAMPEAVGTIRKTTVVVDKLIDLLRNRKEIRVEIADFTAGQNGAGAKTAPPAGGTEQEALLFERFIRNISKSSQLGLTEEIRALNL